MWQAVATREVVAGDAWLSVLNLFFGLLILVVWDGCNFSTVNRERLYETCLAQPEAVEEHPFGPDLTVFKVAQKVFVIATAHGDLTVNVKCDPEVAETLRGTYGSVRAMSVWPKHWNWVDVSAGEVADTELEQWVEDSYDLVVDKLPQVHKLRLQGEVRSLLNPMTDQLDPPHESMR